MFHEILLQDALAYGADFGPGFKTTIVDTGAGGEQRIAQWARPRRRGTIGYKIRSRDQINALRAFYLARRGMACGFRFSDNSDRDVVNEPLANTGGLTLQLQKADVDAAGFATVRTITKPSLAGPFVLYKDGAAMAGGYALDKTTGQIALAASAPGSAFTWSGRFDVPVRFDADWMNPTRDDFDVHSWTGIAIVELLI